MAPTDYTVASAAKMLGSKPPKRREAADIYFARLAAADKASKENSPLQLRPDVKAVRFCDEDTETTTDSAFTTTASTTTAATTTTTMLPTPPSSAEKVRTPPTAPLPAVPKTSAAVKPSQLPLPTQRIKELRAQALPALHSERIELTKLEAGLTNKTATATPSPPAGVSRSTSNASSKRSRNPDDIFFAPVNVNNSTTSLTELLEEEPLPPRQDDFPNVRSDQRRVTAIYSPTEKFVVSRDQIERLVHALIETPMLRVHVQKQHYDCETPDTASTTSLVPSSSSAASSSTTAASILYQHPNQAFLSEHRTPSLTREILEEESARDYPNHPNARHPILSTTGAAAIALVDPKIHGAPIRFRSKTFRIGANTVQVGACTFLNLPYGTSVTSQLRVEPPGLRADGRGQVMLQPVNQVLERRTGRRNYLLVAEVDVTESFTRAALAELAACAGLRGEDVELDDFVTPKARVDSTRVDLCELADQLQHSCIISDTIESAARTFAGLTPETCAMHTLTLLSELERIKVEHQDFLVIRATAFNAQGVASGLQIPWLSQHLERRVGSGEGVARELREGVLAAVSKYLGDGREFERRMGWKEGWRAVKCVPLLEGGRGTEAEAWVCFLS